MLFRSKALPPSSNTTDPRIFKATIGDLASRESVIWQYDGKHYSPTALTRHLAAEHGLVWLANNIFIHWQVAGSSESMWDKAEQLIRGTDNV